jgi:WD repeat-containing protein 89
LPLHSRQLFELVSLSKEYAWGLGKQASVPLPGAHGDELIRAFCFLDREQVVLTAGEDGSIKAWQDPKMAE